MKLPLVIDTINVVPSQLSTVPTAGFCGPTPASSNVTLVPINDVKLIKFVQ